MAYWRLDKSPLHFIAGEAKVPVAMEVVRPRTASLGERGRSPYRWGFADE